MKRRAKAAMLAIALIGCGGTPALPPSAVKDARAVLDEATVRVDAAGPRLLKLHEILKVTCREPAPILPRSDCDAMQAMFNDLGDDYGALSKALDRIDFVMTLVEAAQ